jgi:hypothetical protein
VDLKAGSAEGMTQHIGDINSAARLRYADELGHLLVKSANERRRSGPSCVQRSLTTDQELTVVNRKHLAFNAGIMLMGGTVSDRFAELFGASSRGEMYDRFTLGSARDVELLEAPLYAQDGQEAANVVGKS